MESNLLNECSKDFWQRLYLRQYHSGACLKEIIPKTGTGIAPVFKRIIPILFIFITSAKEITLFFFYKNTFYKNTEAQIT